MFVEAEVRYARFQALFQTEMLRVHARQMYQGRWAPHGLPGHGEEKVSEMDLLGAAVGRIVGIRVC